MVGYAEGLGTSSWDNVNPGGGAFQQSTGTMFIGVFNGSDQLTWATKFGPTLSSTPNMANVPTDIAEDGNGNLFVTGSIIDDAASGDFFPSGGGDTYSGDIDGFLAKFGSNRSLNFATYIGGTGEDYARGVACDPNTGDVIVLGTTRSSVGTGFPIVDLGNASVDDNTLGGSADIFIAKYSNNGALIHSRYFGGDNMESTDLFSLGSMDFNPGGGIVVDPTGNIFITGNAGDGLPTTWPEESIPQWFFEDFSGGTDAFVAAFASNFKLEYCTYLGGSSSDYGSDVAVANSGDRHVIVMVGRTVGESDDYPTSKETELSYFNAQSLGGSMDGVISVIRTNDLIIRTNEVLLPESFASLSPNPCKDVLSLKIEKDDMQGLYMHIYDMSGRLVEQMLLKAEQSNWHIPVQRLDAGNYTLVLKTGSGFWSGKFVKLK